MAESVLYTVILVVYFTGLMALGFRFNRRNRSRQEYFLARGDLGPATLGFSYSATQMSGSSYMGAVGTERELGYNFAPAGVSSAAAAWFTYVLLGERLRRLASRIRCTTIVDVFEARYRGKGVSMTATLLMLLAFIPLIAAQLKAAGNLFEVLLGEMPALWVVSSFLVWGFFQIGGAPAAVTRFLIPKDRGTLRGARVFDRLFVLHLHRLDADRDRLRGPAPRPGTDRPGSRRCWAPPCRRSIRCCCWRVRWSWRTCTCRWRAARCRSGGA